MNATTIKQTILRLSTRHELTEYQENSHISARYRDIGFGADGRQATPPSASSLLQEAQLVRKVTVDRDFDGNLFITLED